MKSRTQTDMIYQHLLKHGTITTMQAYDLYGVTRLSARIWDLRHLLGVKITAKNVTQKNRNGVTINFAEYSLKEQE